MIYTVTLNPALDLAMEVQRIILGDTNRVNRSQNSPGGKGINVSRVARVLGVDSLAMGFVSGPAGRFIEQAVNDLGIPDDFIHTPGQTRTNVIVVDRSEHIHTSFNERGPETDPRHLTELIRRLRRRARPGDWVILSGSLPAGIPRNAYAQIIDAVQKKGAKTVLDADGEVLRLGVAARPCMIKPNRYELERLVGRPLADDAAILDAIDEVRAGGIEIVVASLGSGGSIAVSNDGAWRARSPEVEVNSAVGAGDSLVAGVVVGLSCGDSLAHALRLGTACGAATALTPGTDLCHREDVDRLLLEVEIEELARAGATVTV